MTYNTRVHEYLSMTFANTLTVEQMEAMDALISQCYENRAYHNTDHLVYMLRELENIVSNSKINGFDGDWFYTYPNLVAGILFHDIIYTPGSQYNEILSAALAYEFFKDKPDVNPVAIHSIILATAHTSRPRNMEGELVADLDLAGLAESWEVYSENGKNIRKEYAKYSDYEWYSGRKTFLEKMLARKNIYWTKWFKDKESAARANLQRELNELGPILEKVRRAEEERISEMLVKKFCDRPLDSLPGNA